MIRLSSLPLTTTSSFGRFVFTVSPLLRAFISFIFCCAVSNESPSSLEAFKIAEEITKDTAVAITTAEILAKYAPFGVIAKIAKKLPGDAGAIRPPFKKVSVNTPAIPAGIKANNKIGFMRTYGK